MTSEITQAAYLIEAEKQYTPEASSESQAQSAAPESTGRSETMPDNGSDAGCSIPQEDDLTAVYLYAFHLRDEEVNRLEKQLETVTRNNTNLLHNTAKIIAALREEARKSREKALEEAEKEIETTEVANWVEGIFKGIILENIRALKEVKQ